MEPSILTIYLLRGSEVIDAYALNGTTKPREFKTALNQALKRHPDADLQACIGNWPEFEMGRAILFPGRKKRVLGAAIRHIGSEINYFTLDDIIASALMIRRLEQRSRLRQKDEEDSRYEPIKEVRARDKSNSIEKTTARLFF